MDYQKVAKNIRQELKNYVSHAGLKSLVLGVSGGVDSTVCAVLAKPVCEELNIPLIGRSIPIESNKQDEIDRARLVGECFCHDFKEVKSLLKPYQILEERIFFSENTPNTPIAKGNIKARLRMIYLYNVAGMNNGMVLSTDNYTEMMLSFFTIHGDHNDYGMVQMLWKTEIYGLSKYLVGELENDKSKLALRVSIEAIPTDGLGISNSDFDQLGANSYDEVDKILQDYLTYKEDRNRLSWDDPARLTDNEFYQLEKHPVIQRHLKTEFKRVWPIHIKRETLFQ